MAWDVVSRLLFPTPAASYGPGSFPDELIYVPKVLDRLGECPVELRVPCLFLRYPGARFLIIYLHSNAEDIGKCYGFCHLLRAQFQVHVLAVEYPGYGICPGGPATAASVMENAFAAFRFVREVMRWPADSIKLLGRSIGTGPAIQLAVQYKVAGLILIAPFLSIKELLRDAVGMLSHLVEERFPNGERMRLVRSPTLLVHGKEDTLVPYSHSAKLFERCRGRKQLVCPGDMQHNTNLFADPGYLVLPMLRFFSLPDYCFVELAVPSWAFEADPGDDCQAEVPETPPDHLDSVEEEEEAEEEGAEEEGLTAGHADLCPCGDSGALAPAQEEALPPRLRLQGGPPPRLRHPGHPPRGPAPGGSPPPPPPAPAPGPGPARGAAGAAASDDEGGEEGDEEDKALPPLKLQGRVLLSL